MALTNNETYVKLQLHNDESSSSRKNLQNLFVKGTWYPRHFFMSVLDGCDTWTLHASEELVAIAAGEWGVAVEEYLDQLQLQFSVQNPDSSFSFIPVADTITHLECSFVEEKSQVQHSVTLELEKKQKCGKVAYDILGNLLEHNTKQNDELAHKTRDILRMNAELNELKFTPKTDLNSLRSKPVDQTELQSATSLLQVLPDQDTARRLQPFITKPQQQQQILSSGKTTESLHKAEDNQSAQQSNDTAGRKTFQKTVRHGPRDTDCRLNEAENNAATSSGRKFARPAAEVMVESHSQESEEELSSSVLERQVPYGPGAIETTTATVFTRNSSKIVPDDDDDDEHNDELDPIRTAAATSGWRRNSRVEAYDELQSETPKIQATRLLRQNLKTEADDSDFATAEALQTTAWLRRNSKNGFDEGETQSAELKKKKKSSYTRDPEACRLDTPVIHDVPENQVPGSRRNLKNGSEERENQASALRRSSYAAGVVDGSTSSNTRLVTQQLETPGILVTGSRRNSRNEFDDETQTSAGGGSRKTSLHTRRIYEESSRSRSPEVIQPMMPAGSMRSQRNSKIGSNESETQGAASGGGSRGSSYARFDETTNRPDSSPTEMRVTGSRRNSKIHESINDPETRASPQTRKDSYVRIDESSWSDIIPEHQLTTAAAAAGSRRNSRNEFDDELETTQAPGGGSRRSSSSARPQHESATSRQADDSHEMIRISRRNSMRNELDDDDADELDEALASGSRKNIYASPEAASRRRDSRTEVDDEMDMQIPRLKRNSYATAPVFDNSSNNSSSRPQSPEIIQASSGRRDSRNRFDELDNETEKRRRSSSTTRRRSSSNDARFVDESSSAPAAASSEKQQQISASRRRNSRNEEGDSDEAEDYEEEEEAQGSSGFMSRRSSPYVGLRDASDEMPQIIPEKQVQQAARRNSRNNGFDDEIPETRPKSRSRTNSRSRNSSSSHARLLDDDDESSRQRRWTENSPDLQLRRRNSRTTSEESFGEDHETQGSRNSPYVRRVDQQSSRHESPEKMQGPRWNSRIGFDDPETHASAAARRSSFARLDESNSSMNPDESPKVQAASRRETFSRNEFDEMQGVSGLKRSSHGNDSRSSETPEISRAISSGGSRRESTKNNTGFAVGGGVDHLRSSAALSETQGTTTSSRGSRRNSKIVFNEPERNLYTGGGGGGVAAADESGMLDTHEQIHQAVVAAAAASRRNSQNTFDELETPQQSSAAGFRRNSSSSAMQPDGESPTRRPETTTAEIQPSGSRRHSSIGFDEVDNQTTGLRRNSNRGF